MTASMVHHESTDEGSLRRSAVLHLHDLDHVQVNRLARFCGYEELVSDCSGWGEAQPFEPGGGGAGRIARTASTTSPLRPFARFSLSFVAREVLATLIRVGRSSLGDSLYPSKNWRRCLSQPLTTQDAVNKRTFRDSFFARSKPSAIIVGCTPS
jgi:hypothetical protein